MKVKDKAMGNLIYCNYIQLHSDVFNSFKKKNNKKNSNNSSYKRKAMKDLLFSVAGFPRAVTASSIWHGVFLSLYPVTGSELSVALKIVHKI